MVERARHISTQGYSTGQVPGRGARRASRSTVVSVVLAGLALAAGCGGSDESSNADDAPSVDTTTTTAAVDTTLRVLVTNDDGIDAAGIDAVVTALTALPDTEVTVIAPRANQSGTSGKTSPAPPAVAAATTASGVAGFAVDGFPADSVIEALDRGRMAERPHLVVSGINAGGNIGPFVPLSGTVGAASAAAARGIPALATSQGFGEPPDFAAGVEYTIDWVTEHRAALLDGTMAVSVTNLNTPTCTAGEVRGLEEVPVAADAAGRDAVSSNCVSEVTTFVDDVDAFTNGFATISDIAVDPVSGG